MTAHPFATNFVVFVSSLIWLLIKEISVVFVENIIPNSLWNINQSTSISLTISQWISLEMLPSYNGIL